MDVPINLPSFTSEDFNILLNNDKLTYSYDKNYGILYHFK